ncbi:MAG: hypothetical protein V3V78_04705 [Candidatus Woesearchaeota archaeon]
MKLQEKHLLILDGNQKKTALIIKTMVQDSQQQILASLSLE